MNENDELANALAVVLYQEVRSAGWTLEQLAAELGLSLQTMQRYLSRRQRPMPAYVLTRTARLLGVPLVDIVAAAERRVAREAHSPQGHQTAG